MKVIYRIGIVFVLLFVSKPLGAQTWCPAGAKWHYRIYNPITPFYDGVLELNVTNTVSVNTIVCKQIIGTYYGKTNASFSPSIIINNYVSVKTHSNNGVYYTYNADENKFDTIANFNANVGDKWLLAMLPTGTSTTNPCSFSRPTVSVIGTGTVSINSQVLKKIEISFTTYTNSVYTRTIIEKIGSDIGFLFPSYHCIVDGPEYGDFICYEDPNFTLYKKSSSVNCNYDPTYVQTNNLENEFLVYPNPTKDELTIKIPDNNKYAFNKLNIYNGIGQIVREEEFEIKNNKIILRTNDLPNGVYVLKLSPFNSDQDDGFLVSKRFVIAR